MNLQNQLVSDFEQITKSPSSWGCNGKKYHESLLRSYNILRMAEGCLNRGDSAETVLGLIFLARNLPAVEDYEDEE